MGIAIIRTRTKAWRAEPFQRWHEKSRRGKNATARVVEIYTRIEINPLPLSMQNLAIVFVIKIPQINIFSVEVNVRSNHQKHFYVI